MTSATGPETINPQWFRQVLGRYPTGVALITSTDDDGTPLGMIVGTFTSVSLEPPLVGFLPAKTSTTWPRIRESGHFAVNVLGAGQEDVCRAFNGRNGIRFNAAPWRPAVSGAPLLKDSVAWMDCRIVDSFDAGDHEIVLGQVEAMDTASPDLPLLFFQGGFGRFTPHSMAVAGPDLAQELALVDRARPYMEELAGKLGCDCLAGGRVRDEFVLLASAGSGKTAWLPSIVGQRVPAAAPFGRTAMAWADGEDIERWIGASETADRAGAYAMLETIRTRGYSVSTGSGDFSPNAPGGHGDGVDLRRAMDPGTEAVSVSPEQNVYSIAAPVLAPDGTAVLVLSLYGLPSDLEVDGIDRCARELLSAARQIADEALLQAH